MGDDAREPKLEEIDIVQLARYLGDETAAALVAGRASEAELVQALASLEAMRHAVSTYLPRHILVRQLAHLHNEPWLTWLEGTLLLADVSGSTALAERLSVLGREGTEVITETLNRYFGTMIRLMSEAGGDLLTFGGDALLVFFEGPASVATATATGLTLLHELAGFVREVPGVGQFPLTMHIGIEAGAVALVSCGHPQARRYAVMGRTVTDVARAEHLAKQGELVVGPHAWSTLASYATGTPCTEGFVHLTALHRASPPPPLALPVLPLFPALPSAHLLMLARQLDQLTPYLPTSLLERILAEPERPQVEADLRPVTILFAQISGMTALIEA
ncbi:MAG: adenylate/guanylate cyclase domain-containing protein, partial [Chloroflexia bacterium]|nr:adenylate/guanylate cyclase domain-containing protein [Chloroflexia bacterium]